MLCDALSIVSVMHMQLCLCVVIFVINISFILFCVHGGPEIQLQQSYNPIMRFIESLFIARAAPLLEESL